jgi:uncharacterized protein DUF1097
MSSYIALAVSVGVLAVAATWIFFSVDPVVGAQMQVWQAFIAWGCHYQCGGKFAGTRTTILCMSFGALVGMTAGILANGPFMPLGQFAAPVAVGLGATVICLAAKVPFLGTIPASVYGFASIAGLFLLGTGVTPQSALVPTILSIIVGAAFGYVSEVVAGALKKK